MTKPIKSGYRGLGHALLPVAGLVLIGYFVLSVLKAAMRVLAFLFLFPLALVMTQFGTQTRRGSPPVSS